MSSNVTPCSQNIETMRREQFCKTSSFDLFKPEEVTLCHKEEDGSVSVRRLSECETVREQLDVFTLGEIWTGDGDERLLEPVASEEETGE